MQWPTRATHEQPCQSRVVRLLLFWSSRVVEPEASTRLGIPRQLTGIPRLHSGLNPVPPLFFTVLLNLSLLPLLPSLPPPLSSPHHSPTSHHIPRKCASLSHVCAPADGPPSTPPPIPCGNARSPPPPSASSARGRSVPRHHSSRSRAVAHTLTQRTRARRAISAEARRVQVRDRRVPAALATGRGWRASARRPK